ncbi:hypothetical protein [Pseudorhodobacter sp.]|uniref:hypothetical protein n=1 Tax=Pseudorhodobacter sp. TaxID=1934400 RepID=UPI0039E4900E
MANRANTTAEIENALNAAQAVFTANPTFMAPQTKQFLEAQEQFFAGIEKFSSAWFHRRQEATKSLIEVGRRLSAEGRPDPASAMKEIITWQTGAMARLIEDAKDCTEMMRRCAPGAVQTAAETAAEDQSAPTQAPPQTPTQATKANKAPTV